MGDCHFRGYMMLSDCEAIYGPATYNGGARFSFCSHNVPGRDHCNENGVCSVNFAYRSTPVVVGCSSTQTLIDGQCTNVNPFKNAGPPSGPLCKGNPINIGTGNKYQPETDYQGAGDFPLSFERSYNSEPSTFSAGFGPGSGWRHNYERSISIGSASAAALYRRANGITYIFTLVDTNWQSDADINLKLSGSAATGWQLTGEDGSVETYDATGKLLSIKSLGGATHTLTYTSGLLTSITHSNGRSLTLGYDSASRLSTLTDPSGGVTRYGYNATTGDLQTVSYPDATPADLTDNPVKTYVYNEKGTTPSNTSGADLPHALTGIVDENGKRFATFQYDAQRRAISTEHAGHAGFVGVSY
ncbi:MAG: DUF6531 domain-containing protein, partial [Methylococcaceae bacterium]|nr:DUF6531 domain-containing protein [Methylococcaceae bacterium]